jgi:hypothetical protein
MNCDQFQKNLIDFVYGEIEDSSLREECSRHKESCQSCRVAAEDFHTTRSFLSSWEETPPAVPIVNFSGRRRPLSLFFQSTPSWVAAAAVVVMIFGIFLSVFNISIDYGEGVLQVKFGNSPAPFAAENMQLLRTIDKMQAESENRLNNQMLDTLQNVYYRIQQERSQDRQTMDQFLQQVIDGYGSQLERNNLLLEMNIQNASYESPAK